MSRFPPLAIRSFDDLVKAEREILQRIAKTPNGGNLFMLHPFRLFADVEVKLPKELEAEIVRRFPELSGLSSTAYEALRNRGGHQNVRFHIRGLFRKKKQEPK
jgi:hypothetical protein